MSQLTNPLFESQKEFLERQKQEYKNALLGDVATLKNQSQQVGKTLIMAGGALAGVWLISNMFRGKKEKQPKRGKLKGKSVLSLPASSVSTISSKKLVDEDGSINYADALHQEHPTLATTYYENDDSAHKSKSGGGQSIFQSEMAKALTQQITAFALVYLSKKLEEYLNQPKNPDIATVKKTDNAEIDISYQDKDAV